MTDKKDLDHEIENLMATVTFKLEYEMADALFKLESFKQGRNEEEIDRINNYVGILCGVLRAVDSDWEGPQGYDYKNQVAIL